MIIGPKPALKLGSKDGFMTTSETEFVIPY